MKIRYISTISVSLMLLASCGSSGGDPAASVGNPQQGGSAGAAGENRGGTAGLLGTGGSAGTLNTGGTDAGPLGGSAGTAGISGSAGSGGTAGTNDGGTSCNVGDLRCSGTPAHVLQGCSADQMSWQTLDTCVTVGLCDDSVNAVSSTCLAPTCDVGQKQCSGADLQACNPNRNGWNTLATCLTAQLCLEGLASDAGACATTACKAGDLKCDADNKTLMACKSDGSSWLTSQVCQFICTSGACSGMCSPGTTQCDGNGVQTCQSDGKWGSTIACQASESCSKGACVACSGSGGPSMVMMPQGYCIDSTEVTATQYKTWIATNPPMSLSFASCSWKSNFNVGTGLGDYPVVNVDWCDAYGYCQAVGKRLCGKIGGGPNGYSDHADASKSQWFNACSSGGIDAYPYGNGYNAQTCNGIDHSTGTAVTAGSLTSCRSSIAGYSNVFDLSGNVYEWEDSCDGNSSQSTCHIRGGSFSSSSSDLTCSGANSSNRFSTDTSLGFRCCTI